jgi:3-oxoacyl-[acyl-carrier protein] reductase
VRAPGYAAALHSVAREVGAAALTTEPWVVDVQDVGAVEKRFAALGPGLLPTALLNGVGGDARRRPVTDLRESDLLDSFLYNVVTAFTLMRLVVPEMTARGHGRIVNLASIAGRSYSVFSNAAYVTAKAALLGLTKQYAWELAPLGVTVNAVAHGPIATDRVTAAWHAKSEEERDGLTAQIPVGRLGTVPEAAHLVLPFLTGPSGFATGAVLDVSAGMAI